MIRWLHLSDIHFNYDNHVNRNIKDSLIQYLSDLKLKFDAVIITGDIAYKREYAVDLADYLRKISDATKCSLEDFFICIGNHDFKRGNNRTNTVTTNLKEYLDNDERLTDEQYEYLFTIGHKLFNEKIKELLPNMNDSKEVHRFVDRSEYSVTILNTCLFSHNGEDKNNLYILDNKFYDVMVKYKNQRGDNKINIAIGHHSYDWLNKGQQIGFRNYLANNYIDLYLCGHSHVFDTKKLENTNIRQFTTGSIFKIKDEKEKVCFLIGEFDSTAMDYTLQLHYYNDENGRWDIEFTPNSEFKNGKFTDKLSRREQTVQNEIAAAKALDENNKVFNSFKFQSVQLEIRKKSMDFIGYSNELKKIKRDIENILENPDNGEYLFYHARELYGKSYLCSKLIYDLCFNPDTKELDMTDKGIIFVDGKRANSSSRTIEIIREQASYIVGYPIELENQIRISEEKYQPMTELDKIQKIIFELKKHNKRTLVIIDALNEISADEVQFLPPVLPSGACFLVTSNNKNSSKVVSKKNTFELNGFNVEEIEQILKCNDSKFISDVYKKTKGCPQLILDVADSLKEANGDAAKVKIKTSGKEYFDAKIKEWKSNPILERLLDIFRVFGYVSPLTLDQLQSYLCKETQFADIKGEEILSALETVNNQLLSIEENDTKYYKVYYSLFIDRINEKSTTKDLKMCVEGITKWMIQNVELFDCDVIGRFFVYWIKKIDEKSNGFLLNILKILFDEKKIEVLEEIAGSMIIGNKEISANTLGFFEEYCDKIDSEWIYRLLCFAYSQKEKKHASSEKLNNILAGLTLNSKYIWAKADLGLRLLDGEDIEQNKEEGERLLREAIEQSDVEAMRVLGLRLLDGYNIKQNKEEGERLLREAVRQGNVDAMDNLGRYLLDGKNVEQNKEEGERLLREAIEQGNVAAMNSLGWRLLDGEIVEQNKEEGERLLREAVKQGNVDAMDNLGRYLLDGKNIKQNKEEGERLLREAIEQGNVAAMNSLGWRLLDGEIIKQNKEEGERLLREAVRHGNVVAMRNLGWCLLDGESIKQNKEEGERLLREAVRQGDVVAMRNLGWHLLDGGNIKQNKEEGERLLREAVRQGDVAAIANLGWCLLDGENVEQNKEEGERLLREAIAQGDDEAMRILGSRLLDGENVEQNKEEGERLLREAIAQGNVDAMCCLAYCLYQVNRKNEAVSLFEKAVENGDCQSEINLAYMIRRGEYTPSKNIQSIENLLYKHVYNKKPNISATINYALSKIKLTKDNDKWLEAHKILSKLKIYNKSDLNEGIEWWIDLSRTGDLEGDLVIGWLSKLGLIDDIDGLSFYERFKKVLNDGIFIADWLYQ